MNVSIGIVGATGLVGSTLLRQIVQQAPRLTDGLKATIQVLGVTNSSSMLVSSKEQMNPANYKEQLKSKGEPLELKRFGELLLATGSPCCIMVDCTASDAVPDMYAQWVQMGLHIVAPNKKFGAGPSQRYNALKPLLAQAGRSFMYEATVGAGLPIISTLKSLIETGDRVIKVEGILSGTLSYIFNTYRPGMKFSDVVADAKTKGYTEPDPREDLSGMDMARKVVILARDCGLDVELNTMRVESLVPEPLAKLGSVEEYMAALPEHDGEVAERANAADARGEVIRYVGSVDVEASTCSVSLVSFPASHPFAQLSGSDNMVVFTTERYRERPLVVRGPGAGAEVTAAGVFSDIIQVVRCHGKQ